MKYDVLCLPGVTPPGCGATRVDSRLGDDHVVGDRVRIRCKACGRVRVLEVRGRLTGIEE